MCKNLSQNRKWPSLDPGLTVKRPVNGAGRIKALLLRRQNDYFGDAFGHTSAALWQAAAAAAIEKAQ